MTRSLSPTLTVGNGGSRCSIEIPSAQAATLLAYLRQQGICSNPPQPSSSGMESIALHRGADVQRVQALLDTWTQSRAKKA